jgi:hypothetical protein
MELAVGATAETGKATGRVVDDTLAFAPASIVNTGLTWYLAVSTAES